VHWPAGFTAKGEWRDEPSHLIDLMATSVDAAGAKYPAEYNGHQIGAMEGESLLPVFGGKPLGREALYWEHEGNRAVRMGKWKLVAKNQQPWELYNMEADRTETNDISTANPDLRDKMAAMYDAWASRANVLPGRPERKPRYEPEPLPYPKMAGYKGWEE
jgi:arylsulfatase